MFQWDASVCCEKLRFLTINGLLFKRIDATGCPFLRI